MEYLYPKYVTNKAIDALVKKINLPAPDEHCQDWEYVVSDASRVEEFIHFYENENLNTEEKFALMMIIISSYDDAISEGKEDQSTWNKIQNNLLQDFNVHKNTILYWAALDTEELNDCFSITPLIRHLCKNDK